MHSENGGQQPPLLVLTVACLLDVLFRTSAPAPSASARAGTPAAPRGNAVAAGLGLGGTLYVTHLLFTETASLSRFIVAGYPSTGPPPFPHGLSVLAALAAGLLLSSTGAWVASPVWWGAAAAGAAALVYAEGEVAYVGGLVLGVYVMSTWPRVRGGGVRLATVAVAVAHAMDGGCPCLYGPLYMYVYVYALLRYTFSLYVCDDR
jgi:hypothetical protein